MAFVVPAPISPGKAILISPSGAIATNKPTYSWTADPYATWYYLWVNDSTGTRIQRWFKASEAGCFGGTGTCAVTPDIALADGSGKWWIDTWNANGSGPWSDGNAFVISTMAIP
jgi:hypothetical protein